MATANVSPKRVKIIFEVSVSCQGTELESWHLFISAQGDSWSWPGCNWPVRVSQIKAKDSAFWPDFGNWLRRYRKINLGDAPLIGLLDARNGEEHPIPAMEFQMAVGMICSAFDLPAPVI